MPIAMMKSAISTSVKVIPDRLRVTARDEVRANDRVEIVSVEIFIVTPPR
jgi:hypothetical protein